MFSSSHHENRGTLILFLCWTNSQFNNKISNKKASTPCIVVIMEEIKPFAFVCYNDKIEHEEADEKDPENCYFLLVSLFLISPGCIVFVLPILGKNWHVYYSEGAEWNSNSSGGKTAILQLSDCVIWAFKKPDLELVYCQTLSPGRQKDLFPPCLCVTSPSEKLFSAFNGWIIVIH